MSAGKGNYLNVITRGDLEDITKPSSSRSQTGSRVASSQYGNSSATSTASRLRPQVAAALELLTPEEVMEQDFDLALEEYGSSDGESEEEEDLEEATFRTAEIFRIAEPLRQAEVDSQLEDDYAASRQLTLVGSLLPDDQTEIDSEEENGILKEIRAEITAQIREEMKSELDVYQKKREALTSAAGTETQSAGRNEDEEMDPKLKEAILRMRKLDRILGKKIKREKEVKRERILLQRRLREELANIKQEDGSQESREVKSNTDKFLALTLPPSHNAVQLYQAPDKDVVIQHERDGDNRSEEDCVTVDEAGDSPLPSVTPVFQTQVLDDQGTSNRNNASSQSYQSTCPRSASSQSSECSGQGLGHGAGTGEETQSTYSGATSSTNITNQSGRKKNRGKKNFIKRNVQLASDAANPIAMTEEEKCRVDNLLIGVDSLPDSLEDLDQTSSNPYQVALVDGEGFSPLPTEQRRLADIDSRLKALLPAADFESIASTSPRNVTPQQQSVLFTRTAIDVEANPEELGEYALRETKLHRDVQKRLQDIEKELNTLSSAVEDEIESPALTATQLEQLLDQCAVTMQRATTETDSLADTERTLVTSRASLYENPPRLEEGVLQDLLAEARRDLHITTSQASTPGYHTVNGTQSRDDLRLESVGEDKIQELLHDSRCTSRAASRAPPQDTSDVIVSSLSTKTARLDSGTSARTSARLAPSSGSERSSIKQRSANCGTDSTQRQNDFHGNNTTNVHRPILSQETRAWASFDADELRAAMISNGFVESIEKQPFLPEIDPKGTLITSNKRLNNEDFIGRRPNSSKVSTIIKHNSFSEPANGSQRDSESDNSGTSTPTPHPPQGARPSSGSAGKHRAIVGLSRVSDVH